MDNFNKILVHITDPPADKWMMEKAVDIARRNDGVITIIGVAKEVPEHLESLIQEKFNLDLQRILYDREKRQLQKVSVSFEGKEIEIVQKTIRGRDFREIIKEVLKEDYSLLLTRKIQEKTLREKIFGTETVHLIRDCPCPVWIFPEQGKKCFSKILVAVDTSTPHDEEKKLNEKLLQIASPIAKHEQAELHALHCWEDHGESIPGSRLVEIPVQRIKQYNIDDEKKDLARFREFLIPYRPVIREEHIHFYKEDPGHGIPEVTKNQKIELLILGTLGRSGLRGRLVGNTAERVLNQVDCSVLTIKPDGFVTPVRPGSD